jgi:two-component system, NarL family, nitrate/nitrite response regulator NarL
MSVRVAVMGEDPLVRQGLARGLAGYPGLAVVERLDAQAVVWDFGPMGVQNLPSMRSSDQPVVALVVDPRDAEASLRMGARGVLYRDGDTARIGAAIHAVVSGMVVVDEPFRPGFSTPEGRHERRPSLSPREQQVLGHLAAGRSNKEVAVALDISEHTAKFHVNALLEKLGATTRTEVVVRAIRQGLITV